MAAGYCRTPSDRSIDDERRLVRPARWMERTSGRSPIWDRSIVAGARRPAPITCPESLFSGLRFSSAARARSIGWSGLQGSVRSSLPERLQNERYRAASRTPARE